MSAPLPPLLLRGDCLVELAKIPDASVDAVVTDPPYGIDFMGKDWDKAVRLAAGMLGQIATGGKSDRGPLPKGGTHSQGYANHDGLAFELWVTKWATECLRILKPGGHLLAFGGSRTWHRLAAGIEDAGFEIRDSIAWLYGSGFPKSMDVSKAIDKLDAADERMRRAFTFTAWMRSTGMTAKRIDEITGTAMGNHYTTHPTQPHIATAELFDVLRPHLPEVPKEIERLVAERTVESQNYAARRVTGTHEKTAPGQNMQALDGKAAKLVNPERRDEAHTDAAREWEGWGTALKPAFEPIVVARKPLAGTVAANVLAHGTGGLNIDATRIAHGGSVASVKGTKRSGGIMGTSSPRDEPSVPHDLGRWPANVVLDESQAAELDRQSGYMKDGVAVKRNLTGGSRTSVGATGIQSRAKDDEGYGAGGGASRFFYVAKAPKSERPVVDGTAHPTVKPLALMRWLCRLVCPPGGVVVDPFAGSGTTLEAAYLEGFESIGVEMTPDYWPLIEARIARVTS